MNKQERSAKERMNVKGKNGNSKNNDPFAVMAALAEGSNGLHDGGDHAGDGPAARGTITSGAKLLHYDRNGIGYTAEQVYKIVTYLHELHRKNETQAMKLRNRLNDMLKENGVPIEIAEDGKGTVNIRQMARDGPDR